MRDDFITKFDTFRQALRGVFLYGFFSRYDKKIADSIKTYDDEKRRILTFIADDSYVQDSSESGSRRRILKMLYDMFLVTENYLSDAYAIKKMRYDNMILLYKILQILAATNKPIDISEIIKLLDDKYAFVDEQGECAEGKQRRALGISDKSIDIDEYIDKNSIKINDGASKKATQAKIRHRLNSLIELGWVIKTGPKSNTKYCIVQDPLENLTDKELLELWHTVKYFMLVSPISVPGYTLANMLKVYAETERYITLPQDDNFMVKDQHLQKILDEEMIGKFVTAINKHYAVTCDYESPRQEKTRKIEFLPRRILLDELYGRWFVFGTLVGEKSLPILLRVDRINEILKIKKYDKSDVNADNIYKQYLEKSWCVSPRKIDKDPVRVELRFHLNEFNKDTILRRLKNEGKSGEIKELSEFEYCYSIDVTDEMELKPWIRSFIGCVEVVKSDMLRKSLYGEWEEQAQNYGVI